MLLLLSSIIQNKEPICFSCGPICLFVDDVNVFFLDVFVVRLGFFFYWCFFFLLFFLQVSKALWGICTLYWNKSVASTTICLYICVVFFLTWKPYPIWTFDDSYICVYSNWDLNSIQIKCCINAIWWRKKNSTHVKVQTSQMKLSYEICICTSHELLNVGCMLKKELNNVWNKIRFAM